MGGPLELPKPGGAASDYFDVTEALEALTSGAAMTFPPMQATRTRIGDRDLSFFTNYHADPIQKSHRKGLFYEHEDLSEVAKLLPDAPRVLDVGANVGNHSLFFATQCGAQRIVVIEPNPLALAPLVANVVFNQLTDVIGMEALGVGLGAQSEGGLFMRTRTRNLGGTRMQRGKDGTLEVHAGDALFADETFDLIKIDVEGMEMDVLAGLAQTIDRCRPLLFVEVDDANIAAFKSWCDLHGYVTRYEQRRYRANMNFLVEAAGARS
ncbi:FkbM family methyltransferase [Sagittula sp. NFXS13]|uniref:FkbM family methyltransferase n=1 Tax=Sagittula sp. NFXS13 TaxID=2819095 RepID=UPI0032DF85E4